MNRLLDCQVAVAQWGTKAKFKRARIGLLRKNDNIYIMIVFSQQTCKFIIDRHTQIMPAAIRLNNLETDLFVRQVDEIQYSTMVRQIKVILRREELSRSEKANAFNQLIATIPTSIDAKELVPSRISARIVSGDNVQDDTFGQKTVASKVSTSRLDNKQLKSIKISGLETLPPQLWARTILNQLSLIDCNLTTVPKQIESFTSSLTSLNLSNNGIETIPASFCCNMGQLQLLDLSDNKIRSLPLEIKFFKKLTDFNISHNQLKVLPSTFSDLISLESLNVANNQLIELPAFREDVRLKVLDVSHNPLNGNLSSSAFLSLSKQDNEATANIDLFPRLFNIALLRIVQCDEMLKLASSDPTLPRDITSTIQNEVFKCYLCKKLCNLPAHQTMDVLEYVDQAETLITTGNYRHGMTFVRLLCQKCFSSSN